MRLSGCLGFVFLAGAALLSAGCGGGGGGGGHGVEQPPAQTISGVVAGGAPLAGYTVEIISAADMSEGSSLMLSGSTDAKGHYSITMPSTGLRGPYLISARMLPPSVGSEPLVPGADRAYEILYALALQPGLANVNPLTHLQLAYLEKDSPAWFKHFNILAGVNQSQLDAARQAVVDYLLLRTDPQTLAPAPVDASIIGDFVTTPMSATANDRYDIVLEQLRATMQYNDNIFSLETDMLDRLSTQVLDLSLLAGQVISCEANHCGTQYDAYNSVIPEFTKTSVLLKLSEQINRHPLSVNCGVTTPSIPYLSAGSNSVFMTNGVLRMNSGYALTLLSSWGASFRVATSPNADGYYFKEVFASDRRATNEYNSVSMRFSSSPALQIDQLALVDMRGSDADNYSVQCTH